MMPRCAIALCVIFTTTFGDQQVEPCKVALSWVFETNKSLGYCHMSMIEAIDNQTLIVSFQAARVHEGFNDQSLYSSRSTDGGKTWSDVSTLVSGGDYAVWGPVFHYDPGSEKLWLFYAQSGPFDQSKTKGRSSVGGDINYVTSQDGGLTWTAPTTVLPYRSSSEGNAPKITANKMIVLNTGRWVLPFWESPQAGDTAPQRAGVLLSDDAGETWSPRWVATPTKLIENTVAEVSDGSILQLFRTGTGKLYQAWSHDGGLHWTTANETVLPNPNSKTFLFTDSLGRQILSYNPVSHGRNPLALAISQDGGKSFHEYCNLDPGQTKKALEYPTSVQVGSNVFTTFSADHYTGIKLAVTLLPN